MSSPALCTPRFRYARYRQLFTRARFSPRSFATSLMQDPVDRRFTTLVSVLDNEVVLMAGTPPRGPRASSVACQKPWRAASIPFRTSDTSNPSAVPRPQAGLLPAAFRSMDLLGTSPAALSGLRRLPRPASGLLLRQQPRHAPAELRHGKRSPAHLLQHQPIPRPAGYPSCKLCPAGGHLFRLSRWHPRPP